MGVSKWPYQLALAKTAIMHMGHSNPHFSYSMEGTPLNEIDAVKDFGVNFSPTLKFSNHVNLAVKKPYTCVNLIFQSSTLEILFFLLTCSKPLLDCS